MTIPILTEAQYIARIDMMTPEERMAEWQRWTRYNIGPVMNMMSRAERIDLDNKAAILKTYVFPSE